MIRIGHLSKFSFPTKGGIEKYVDSLLINNENFKSIVLSNANKNEKYFIESSGTYHKLSTQLFFKSQPVSFNFIKVCRFLKGVDIVHLHIPYPTMELMLGTLLTFFKNKKLVITYHANPNKTRWKFLYIIFRPFLWFNLYRCKLILITSKYNLDNSNIPKSLYHKVRILPIGIDFSNGDKNHVPKRLNGSRVKIIFVGRLREYKGLNILLDAIKYIDVDLVIVGDGELKSHIQNYISENNLEKRVFLYSDVSDTKLADYYKESDIFVLPSINESETFGIVQIEAMKYGLPVINTSLKTGVPEVSIDGITGLTVSPNSVFELTAAINKMITNNDLYETFSKNALNRSKEFSNDLIKVQYENFLNQIILEK